MTTPLIVGGGIAGPVAAMALQKAGIDSTVFERHPTSAASVGSFMTLGSNGLAALEAIDAVGAVEDLGFPTPEISLRSYTGKVLGNARISATAETAPVSRTVRRADLYEAIREEAERRGIVIEHGKELVRMSQGDDGVTAHFADGSTRSGDLLIGSDGVRSRTRATIDPGTTEPDFAGLIGLGGYTAPGEVDVKPGSYEMIFGRRAFFGYAVAPDGEVWWFANLPRSYEPGRAELDSVSGEKGRETLLAAFADDAGPAVALIEGARELLPASPMHTVPSLPSWHDGRAVLLGDAAHAPSPTSGQGASLAIEDAVELAKCLRDLPDVSTAVRRFESVRRPRVERIVRDAAKVNSNKASIGLARWMRDLVLPFFLKKAAGSDSIRQTYDYVVAWD